MANDLHSTGVDTDHSDDDDPIKPGKGPGHKYVSLGGIIFVSVYLLVTIILCLYGLLVFWPAPNPAGGQEANQAPTQGINTATTRLPTPTAPAEQSPAPAVAKTSAPPSPTPTPSSTPGYVTVFGKTLAVYDEVRLLWIVIFAGALGSLIHAVRSVYWYVGNRKLIWSWSAKYLMLPFAGSALAVVFYLVIRGGFFSPQAGFGNTSPFGFAAMAALVGLFSEQAVLKLQEIAETVFTKPPPGADSKPQKSVTKSESPTPTKPESPTPGAPPIKEP
jgi:hypothetical protein